MVILEDSVTVFYKIIVLGFGVMVLYFGVLYKVGDLGFIFSIISFSVKLGMVVFGEVEIGELGFRLVLVYDQFGL